MAAAGGQFRNGDIDTQQWQHSKQMAEAAWIE
jgi:hypothetical protein